MSSHIINKLITFLCLGSCFALISQTQPAQGQINNNRVLLVQQTIIAPLPPPDIPIIIDNQQPLPQVQPGEIQQFEANPLVYPSIDNPYQQDPLLSQPNQYSQNFERYLVYVDSGNYQTLQQVKQIEPGAYIRQYQGRSIIQSGVFSRESNAQQRVRELASYGIPGARIISFSNGQQIQTQTFNNPRVDSEPRNKRYYVIIPAKTQDLPVIANTIISRTGYSNLVQERQKPFGSHVAVGPFAERGEAERWNKYMQELGFGNARVYFNR